MSELKPADSATSSIAIQQNSRSYIPPALDQEVLRGDSMRRVRFLLEYAKAEEALRACGKMIRKGMRFGMRKPVDWLTLHRNVAERSPQIGGSVTM